MKHVFDEIILVYCFMDIAFNNNFAYVNKCHCVCVCLHIFIVVSTVQLRAKLRCMKIISFPEHNIQMKLHH